MKLFTPTRAQFSLVHFELLQLDKYQDKVEGYFRSNAKNIEAQIDFAGIGEDGEDRIPPEAYMEMLHGDYQEFQLTFPNHFRASFLSQMASFIENRLKKLACLHYSYTHPDFFDDEGPDFLKGAQIKEIMNYLKKTGDMKFAPLKHDWDMITVLYKLRNVFTHHNGYLRKGNKYYKEVNNFINKNPGLASKHFVWVGNTDNYLIILNEELNRKLLDITRSFFHKILDENLKLIIPSLL